MKNQMKMEKLLLSRIRPALLLPLALCIVQSLSAQISTTEVLKKTDTLRNAQLTSLKTNTLAEVLQASINNGIISGNGAGINLKTTLFGLKKLIDPGITIDTLYQQQTFSRNFELGFGVKMDNNNAITGVTGSAKYALINHRDLSRYDSKILSSKAQAIRADLNRRTGEVADFGNKLPLAIMKAKDDGLISEAIEKKMGQAAIDFTNGIKDTSASVKAAAMQNFSRFFLPYIQSKQIDLDSSFFKELTDKKTIMDSLSNSLVNEIKKGPLLTLGINSNYVNKQWDSLSFQAEYILGLGWQKDSTKPWDLYAAGFLNLKQDTVSKQSLHRQVWSAKFGLNKVLATKKDGSSFLEVLGAAEYDYIHNGYATEKTSTLTADFTITVRLSSSIFLPFELKYDPNAKNFFGYLSVKWDLLRTSLLKN